MHRFILALFITVLSLSACAPMMGGALLLRDHPLTGRIWDVGNSRFIDTQTAFQRAMQSELVLLGETHDNAEHHRLQIEVLNFLAAQGLRPTLLLEQFDTEQQAALDSALGSGADPATLLRGWDAAQYRPLLAQAAAQKLPLVAANLSRTAARPLVREGFAAMPAQDKQSLAIDAAWDERRESYLAGVIDNSHCGAITPQLGAGLVRAQRWRDATLADTALRHIGQRSVFILGRGHARRDIGVPRYIEVRRSGTRMLSIGFVEVSAGEMDPAGYEAANAGEPAHDLLWFTARTERPDPCLAFKNK